MSRSLNRVELLGHIGQQADVRFTPSGIQVAQFSLATNRKWKDKASGEWKEATDWHKCVFWRCENLVNYLTKGRQLLVVGRLQTRDWTDQQGVKHWITEVVIEELYLLGDGRGSGQGASAAASAQGSSGPPPPGDPQGITDEDVPF